MWLTLGARLTFGARLTLGSGLISSVWLLVFVTHVIPADTQGSPLNIRCFNNGSINVTQKNSYSPEIFVFGSGPTCSDAMRHFTVDPGGHFLNTTCQAGNGYILQVLDFPKTHAPGFTLTVYNVSCNNSSGNASGNAGQVIIAPATDVPYLEEIVLPTLHIAILPPNTALKSSMTSSSLTSMYLGQELMLTIYNDRSQGRASYMLVPTLCEAYPAADPSVRLTLLKQGSTGCTKQDGVIGKFTIERINDVDVAWAPLYGFMFANYPDSDLIIDCTVLVCSATSTQRKGNCTASSNSCYNKLSYGRRRKRYAGVSRDINAESGRTARTRVKLKYSLASRARVTTAESLLLLVALTLILV